MQVWTSQDMEEEKVTQGWGAGVSVTHGRRKKDPGSQSCGSSGRKDTGARRAESIRENRTPTASDAIAIDRSGRLEAIAVGNKGVSQARGKKMSEEEDGRAGCGILPPPGPWPGARLLAPARVSKKHNILAQPGSWEISQVPALQK